METKAHSPPLTTDSQHHVRLMVHMPCKSGKGRDATMGRDHVHTIVCTNALPSMIN